jgi:uncharacterized short protein YbdD (DUF466 family)
MMKLKFAFSQFWQRIRELSGDDAYERYLAHFVEHQKILEQENTILPLSREAFFKQWQKRKWEGIKRCC